MPSRRHVTPRTPASSRYSSASSSHLSRIMFSPSSLRSAARAGRAVGSALKKVWSGKKGFKPVQKKAKTLESAFASNDLHSGANKSTVRIRVGKSKGSKLKTIGKWEYVINYTTLPISSVGEQSLTPLCFVLTKSQLATTTGSTYTLSQSAQALQQMNPYLTNTGSTMWAAKATPATDKFIVKGIEVNMSISNLGTNAVEVEIYAFVCKKSTANPVSTEIDNGFVNQNMNTTGSMWAVQTGATGFSGGETIKFPFAKPKDSRVLGQFYKTLHVKSILMSGGASELVNYHLDYNKLIKMDFINDSDAYIANTTVQFYAIIRGQVGRGQATTAPTFTPAELGVISTVKYYMCAVKDNASRLDVNYVTSQAPADISGTKIINYADVSTAPVLV